MLKENDHCTMWFEGDWADCCIEHDYDYADGGKLKEAFKESRWQQLGKF
jgi:hypothetical protein